MQRPSDERIVKALLDSNPRSFAGILGISIEDGSSESLFRMLCASLLLNARVTPEMAIRAFNIITARHWTNPQYLHKSTLEERIEALEEADYVIFDENISAARWLGEMARDIIDRYNGNLKNVRTIADRNPSREREIIKEFRGIGDMQADIFFREVQLAWEEQFPFLSSRAFNGARKLDLPTEGVRLALLAGDTRNFPRLVEALEQVDLTGNFEEILSAAQQLQPV